MSASKAQDSRLDAELQQALVARLTAMADDELVLGHRDSEWTGHAPLLEEDIALANIAQDEIGHALLWLQARSELDGSDPDELAFFREVGAFRNARLVELPKGDWAFTMLRQYLFDAFETELLSRLRDSRYPPLAEAAAKAAKEEVFHLRHSGLWLERLALGTDESRSRLTSALQRIWPYLPQLWQPLPGDAALQRAGIAPNPADLEQPVMARVSAALAALGLEPPADAVPNPGGRDRHGEALVSLLVDMQSVARADPGVDAW
ncbi:MAG: phenylacetate-CoA oxygenase subunit PaaC [Deinococcales bacterium]